MRLPSFTTLREWAHSLSAVVGIIAVVYGIVIEAMHTAGVTVPTQYAQQVAGFGVLLVLVSKGIDSLNNALTSISGAGGSVSSGSSPTTPAQAPAPAAEPTPAPPAPPPVA